MEAEAYDKGYNAFLDGQELDANPYDEGSDEFEAFEAGWFRAADEEIGNEDE